MNKQACMLIVYLMNNTKHGLTIEQLSKEFNVSERTLRNYWNEAQSFLVTNQLDQFFVFSSQKISFFGNNHKKSKIYNLLSQQSFYDYRLSVKERQQLLMLILLCSDTPITITQLKGIFFVSKTTVLSDIKSLNQHIKDSELRFDENKNLGFHFSCDECVRRQYIFSILEEMSLVQSFPWSKSNCYAVPAFINKLLQIDKFRQKAEKTLQSMEKKFNLEINDEIFYSMSLYLCITMFRLNKEHYVTTFNYNLNLKEYNKYSYKYSRYLIDSLFKVDFTFKEKEILCFYKQIENLCLFKMQENQKPEYLKFHFITKSLLYKLSTEYSINLIDDQHLHNFLTNHILYAYHRVKSGEPLINPFQKQLIEKHKKEYNILKNNINILYKGLNCSFSDNEVTYILMHILAAIERNKISNYVPRVIIACNGGMGTANYLLEKIKKKFKINVVSVSSIHNLSFLIDKNHVDFVISTSPLQDIHLPWTQVNVMLTSKDIENIQRMIDFIIQNKQKEEHKKVIQSHGKQENNKVLHKTSRFSDLLIENHVVLDKSARDWQEAIINAGEPMLWSNHITANYIQAMINVVHELGPYIVFAPGVALAHAGTDDGVLQASASFIRLENPVLFGNELNDPVRFVIGFAMDENKLHLENLMFIMNTMFKDEVICLLNQANTYEDVVHIINNAEREYSYYSQKTNQI